VTFILKSTIIYC